MGSSLLFGTLAAAAVGCFTLYKKFRFHQGEKEMDSSSLSPSQPPSSLSTSSPSSSLSPSSPPSSLSHIMAFSPFSHSCTHDVFPSFHGPDVRKAFLSHILKEFRSKGIGLFVDNEIKRGESIGPELKRGIRGSKIAIVLLSKNYASSSWCLDELVEIMNKVLGQTVITIFYEVDPTDVKKQTGDFGKVFKKTCRGKTVEKIETWRKALEGVATIAGYHSRNWVDEAAMIENIGADISKMLNRLAPSPDLDRLIGIGAHMERMQLLLRLDLEDEVRMIGIWGPAGIGKSTIARFLFNQLSNSFPLSAIMENIKGSYPRPCLDEGSAQLQLQSQMLSKMINHKDTMIPHLGVAQERLKDKKVLLVLDDVDQLAQLDALARESQWFGPGSRIIITTEDLRVLKAHGINHIYKVHYPIDEEALQIFCMHAFGQKSPYDGFEELAREVIEHSGRLPLGLTVMGSHLRGMSKQEWKMALPRLRNSLDGKIESVLKFSYDALCDEDKNLFLHIACFFIYQGVEKVEEHLAKKFVGVKQGLHVLAEKSLISIRDQRWIYMHSLLVQLGKEIVRKQSDHELGQRQFLVDDKDICEILTDPTAIARSVIGIKSRDTLWDNLNLSERAFEGMSNLQFLKLHGHHGHPNIASLTERLKYTSPKLQLLEWEYCPMTCLPFIVNLEFLVELIMRHSQLEKLWEGIKLLRNLKWMDLSYSKNLNELPNLSNATNLQILYLSGCSSLVELPSSIGNAANLQKLYLNGCSSLVELPSSIGNATNLQKLDLSKCSSLVELPSSIGNATNLQILDLNGCSSLVEFPSSIENATNLQKLDLRKCSSLVELPSSIGNATNLQKLDLRECSSLVELPSSIGNATNLQELDLSGCSSLVELPSSIGNAANLRKLSLGGCSSLMELPSSIGNATNLQELDLSGCSSLVELPSSIGNAANLQKLYLNGCSSLVELPSSIGNATNLRKLSLGGCSSLVKLPSSIGNATNLQKLDLRECSSLVELPSSIGNAANLQELDLSGCSSLVELPFSIGNAANLQKLSLGGCSSQVELPSSIGNATNLQKLDLRKCSSLVELPSSIGNAANLQELDLSGCSSLVALPSSIENATNLQKLDLRKCSSLVELPSSIGNATNLQKLDLRECSSLLELPSSIGNATNLQELDLRCCSSLVELPPSIGKLHRLTRFNLEKCSKLEVLPTNINLESLNELNLTNCSSLKSFPEISTNIRVLKLSGTAIKEVPSSIRSWSRLNGLEMSYSENLKESPHAFDIITELHLTDTRIQELSPWVKEFSRLSKLVLNEMQNLVSLPQLPDSLWFLYANNCESLERLDCSFRNRYNSLNFRNCFKLNQEARDLIIQTSTSGYSVLPGGEVPACFTYRASGSSLTVKLNEKPLRTSTKFKACILLVNKGENEVDYGLVVRVKCRITSKQNALTSCRSYGTFFGKVVPEHLYIFDVEAAEVTSTELDFEFNLGNDADNWKMKECGILQLLELQVDEDSVL